MLSNTEELATLTRQLRQRETAIGMAASMLAGFPGTAFVRDTRPAVSLKTLYSDFVVRELSPCFNDGEPLVLEGPASCVIAPSSGAPAPDSVNSGRKRPREAAGDGADRSKRMKEEFGSLLSEDDLAALLLCVANDEPSVQLRSVTDKEKRKAVHQAVKAVLGGTHVSSTDNGCLVVSKADAAARRAQERRSNPSRQRKFLHFTLYKENLDTNQAFRAMADLLRISARQFQFCGTKDKRAITLQRVALRDMDPRKLAGLNQRASMARGVVRVCSFREEEHGLRLGDALGNRFHIVMRLHAASPASPASGDKDEVARHWTPTQLQAIESALSTTGAINYYGPQRFGTTEVLTSDVGLRLLQGDYHGAIELMFLSRARFVPELAEVLPLLAAREYEAAKAKVPYFCRQEQDILRHLAKAKGDYLGALQTLPRTLAMLYFHAVQSLIWNRMVSRRLTVAHPQGTTAGDRELPATRVSPEVGDLVLAAVYERRRERKDASAPIHTWSLIRESEEDGGGGDRQVSLPATHTLSADDDLSLFSLKDVILPVPGPDKDLQFPTAAGCSRGDYEEEARALGIYEGLLSEEAGSGKNALLKVFHYHGTYRPVCVVPQRVRLSLLTVPTWRSVVVPSDLDELRRREALDVPATTTTEQEQKDSDSGGANAGTPPVQTIVTEFSLPPGSYATSVLREFSVCVSESFHKSSPAAAAQTAGENAAHDVQD